jgi:hypothetical protein
MKKTIRLTLLSAFILNLFTACSPEVTIENVEVSLGEKRNSSDYSISETLFNEAYNLVDMESQKQPVMNGLKEDVLVVRSCPSITVSPSGNTFPKTMTLDYGSGCTARSGVSSSGKITAVFTGRPRKSGTNVTVTFDNFIYKGYKLSGTYAVSYTSATGFTAQITNGNITTPDGKTLTYQATSNLTQTEGTTTTFLTNGEAGLMDDVYTISGSSSGKDANGVSYSTTITKPLVKKLDCQWISAGTVEIKVTGQATKLLDFGTGTCDNQATVTIGRLSTNITIL